MTMVHRLRGCVTAGAALILACGPAVAAELATAWNASKPETRARLLAGQVSGRTMAAIEIGLADGWKTYWRFPGDAGGVPPMFDWEKSENLQSAKVLFPAPKRMTDKAGDTLGYATMVAFPIEIVAKDATKPVSLKVQVDYGVCREICIPVEAILELVLQPGETTALPASVSAALERVPRTGAALRANDPKVIKSEVKLDGDRPTIAIEAEFPGGTAAADAFVEGPNGYYIPLPKAGSAKDLGKDRLRFEIDLTGAVEPADIKGKTASVTLISGQGLSETPLKIE